MKKKKVRSRIEKAIKLHLICSMQMEYSKEDYHFFPLKMSETLFLGAREEEFQLNGCSIRRMQDIERVKILDNFCGNISIRETGDDAAKVPEVDISDWFSAFTSLEKLGKIIIVEKESLHEKNNMFAIGKIEKVCRKHVCLRYFGPDGIWDDEQWKIPYDDITSVTIGSRYAEVFSKYLPEPPAAPGGESVAAGEADRAKTEDQTHTDEETKQ